LFLLHKCEAPLGIRPKAGASLAYPQRPALRPMMYVGVIIYGVTSHTAAVWPVYVDTGHTATHFNFEYNMQQ